MFIRIGFDITYEFAQASPMLLTLNVHASRAGDLVVPDRITTYPPVSMSGYHDGFGNWCTRLVAPAGLFRITANGVVWDSGLPEMVSTFAAQHSVEDLPEDVLVYLLGSRYCETDLLMDIAWQLFAHTPLGGARVQAVCDFVHSHIAFSYADARPTRTAFEAYNERRGVCRDYAHLAVALCRCLNIPARYCTGYLGDMGAIPPPDPMDFAGWFEAYLGGTWHVFDARNNTPRIGRILMARGRDATDVALSTAFGVNRLVAFEVVAREAEAWEMPALT